MREELSSLVGTLRGECTTATDEIAKRVAAIASSLQVSCLLPLVVSGCQPAVMLLCFRVRRHHRCFT
jgi:hypothetical protein